jgi:hypothetical protein
MDDFDKEVRRLVLSAVFFVCCCAVVVGLAALGLYH